MRPPYLVCLICIWSLSIVNADLVVDLDALSFAAKWSSITQLKKQVSLLEASGVRDDTLKELRSKLTGARGIYQQLLDDVRGAGPNKTLPLTELSETDFTIGLEFGACNGGNPGGRRLLTLAVPSCTNNGITDSVLLPHITVFDEETQRSKACDVMCPDSALTLIADWAARPKHPEIATRLVIFSPAPLNACTAVSLSRALQQYGQFTDLDAIDEWNVWHNERVAIMVGDDSRTCVPPTAPFSKQSASAMVERDQTCQNHLQAIEPSHYKAVFEQLIDITEQKDSSGWPSFNDLLATNLIDYPKFLNVDFANMPCSEWSNQGQVRSPTLIKTSFAELEGPAVSDIFHLASVGLRIASVSPKMGLSNELSGVGDEVFEDIARICSACRSNKDLSYKSIYDEFKDNQPFFCRNTVLSGMGRAMQSLLEDSRMETSPMQHRLKKGRKTVTGSIFESCSEGDTLEIEGDLYAGDTIPRDREVKVTVIPFKSPSNLLPHAHIQFAGSRSPLSVLLATLSLQKGKPARISIPLEGRQLIGMYHLESSLSLQDGPFNFSTSIGCSRTPELQHALPVVNPPCDNYANIWQGIPMLHTPVGEIPLRHHILSYDLKAQPLNAPYNMQTLAYLISTSIVISLQSARDLEFADLALPASIRNAFVLTDSCSDRFGLALQGERFIYRKDVMDVDSCLGHRIRDVKWINDALMGGWRMPNVALMTSKHNGQKVSDFGAEGRQEDTADCSFAQLIVINVNFAEGDIEEASLLVTLMEHFRMTLGFHLVVTGLPGTVHSTSSLEDALHRTALWRNFYPPALTPQTSHGPHIWLPFQPKESWNSATHSEQLTSERMCLMLPTQNSSATSHCDHLAVHAEWFRSHSEILMADKLHVRHHQCASLETQHLPVSYDIQFVEAARSLSLVTYNIETIDAFGLGEFFDGQTVRMLVRHDIIVLQGPLGFAGSSDNVLRGYQHTYITDGNLQIFWRASTDGPKMLKCLQESRRQSSSRDSVLGCLFEYEQERFVVLNVNSDDSLSSGNRKQKSQEFVAMRLLYGKLCLHHAGTVANTGVEVDCATYPIPGFFAGTWASDLRYDMSWEDFEAAREKQENTIRTSLQADSQTTHSQICLPPERDSQRSSLDTHTWSGLFEWVTSQFKGDTNRLWPYWTQADGKISDFLTVVGPMTARIIVPRSGARIHEFAESPACTGTEFDTVPGCQRTDPPCSNFGIPVGIKFGTMTSSPFEPPILFVLIRFLQIAAFSRSSGQLQTVPCLLRWKRTLKLAQIRAKLLATPSGSPVAPLLGAVAGWLHGILRGVLPGFAHTVDPA
ncbi:hypothetical protein DFJ77DRAFT_542903 [Powellomyces hirtus]|nr:hypothetical protein DFJ77DRAFT_542903 [Powellomyces hirtus]